MQNLFEYQRKYIPQIGVYGRLTHSDIVRLSSGLDTDIFRTNACVGYRRSLRNRKHFLFSYEGHKVPLNRLLYHNYISDVEPGDIIVNTCVNSSFCCNIRHITKRSKRASQRTKKLSEDQVIAICRRLMKGDPVTEIAKDFNVSRMSVNNIRVGKSHRAITERNNITVDELQNKKNEKNENLKNTLKTKTR